MSFSSDVKDELLKNTPNAIHCQMAELASSLVFGNTYICTENGIELLRYVSDNSQYIKRVGTLLKKVIGVYPTLYARTQRPGNKTVFGLYITGKHVIKHLLRKLFLVIDENNKLVYTGNELKLKNCCRFSFLRGAFLMAGTVADPAKTYHFEINAVEKNRAEKLNAVMSIISDEIKLSDRNDRYSVYLKDSSSISDVLAAMGANVSVMKYENTKIYNETRGLINRRVNCEIGNLKKAAAAGQKQIDSIILLKEKYGLESLPEGLRRMAELRLENPEASLQELGEMFSPPLGKSGVNHRLQKLVSMAEDIVDEKS